MITMKPLRIIIAIGTLLLAACATAPKTTAIVTEPATYTVANECYVDRPFAEVWDGLVAELAKSFFVINNIEKESRIINLSFSTTAPEDYIDCGRTTRTYKKGKTEQVFEYEIAKDSAYKYSRQVETNAYANYDVSRRTTLDGRINVFLAPEGAGTRVTVNVRFIFNVETSGVYEVIAGALEIRQSTGVVPPTTYTLSFDTRAPGKDNLGTPSEPAFVTCGSNGKLETSILDMARK